MLLEHWETVRTKIENENENENAALAIRRLQGSLVNPSLYGHIQTVPWTENVYNLLSHPDLHDREWDNPRVKYIFARRRVLEGSFPNMNTGDKDARMLLYYEYYLEIIVKLVQCKDAVFLHTDEEIAAQWNAPRPNHKLYLHVSQPLTANDVARIRDKLSRPSLAWAYQEIQLFWKDLFTDLYKDSQEASWVRWGDGFKRDAQPLALAKETTSPTASTLLPATLNKVSVEIWALCLSARWQGQTCKKWHETVKTFFNVQKGTLQRLEKMHGIRYTQWLTFQKSPIVALHLDLKALLDPQVVRDIIGLANVVSIFLQAYRHKDSSYANLAVIENAVNQFVEIKSLQRLDFGKWLWTKENLERFQAVRFKSCGADCTIHWISDD